MIVVNLYDKTRCSVQITHIFYKPSSDAQFEKSQNKYKIMYNRKTRDMEYSSMKQNQFMSNNKRKKETCIQKVTEQPFYCMYILNTVSRCNDFMKKS